MFSLLIILGLEDSSGADVDSSVADETLLLAVLGRRQINFIFNYQIIS